MLPKERKSEKILTFTEEANLFEDGRDNAEDEMKTQHSDGGNVRIKMRKELHKHSGLQSV